MLEADLDDKLLERLGHIDKVYPVIEVAVVVLAVDGLMQVAQIAAALLLHAEAGDLGLERAGAFRDGAGIAAQAVRIALIQRGSILADDERLDLAALENGLVQALVQTHQAVAQVEHELGVPPAEIDVALDVELVAQLLVFLAERAVGLERLDRHVVHRAVRQVNGAVAVVADVLAVDLPRQ